MTTQEPRSAATSITAPPRPYADVEPIGAPLGPGSLTWKFHGDRRGLLFLWRSGTLQNMHPAVNSALQQHSNFFADPWDRPGSATNHGPTPA